METDVTTIASFKSWLAVCAAHSQTVRTHPMFTQLKA